VELAEYVNTPVGQKIFTEAMMPDIVEMVKVNLFRTLPPQADDFDPEEDEPAMEPAWPHLQVVYEFFLRFIVSTEVNGKVAKKYVDQTFIRMWIELFDAEDPRERDYVKTVLHRMYGKFMSYRSYIRKAISQVFFRYIYETGRCKLKDWKNHFFSLFFFNLHCILFFIIKDFNMIGWHQNNHNPIILCLQAQWDRRTLGDLGEHHQRVCYTSQEGALAVP
jgi:hypothetical protein